MNERTQSKEIGRFRVVVTQYVPPQSPWFCTVIRTADGEEFSLRRYGYSTSDEAIAVGEAWARDTIAING
jgi:hypothetical protein